MDETDNPLRKTPLNTIHVTLNNVFPVHRKLEKAFVCLEWKKHQLHFSSLIGSCPHNLVFKYQRHVKCNPDRIILVLFWSSLIHDHFTVQK